MATILCWPSLAWTYHIKLSDKETVFCISYIYGLCPITRVGPKLAITSDFSSTVVCGVDSWVSTMPNCVFSYLLSHLICNKPLVQVSKVYTYTCINTDLELNLGKEGCLKQYLLLYYYRPYYFESWPKWLKTFYTNIYRWQIMNTVWNYFFQSFSTVHSLIFLRYYLIIR